MGVKTEIAAVVVLAAVGTALAVGLMLGVIATKAAAPERIPACNCQPATMNT